MSLLTDVIAAWEKEWEPPLCDDETYQMQRAFALIDEVADILQYRLVATHFKRAVRAKARLRLTAEDDQ